MDRRTALGILSGAVGAAATAAAGEREGNLQSTSPKPHLRKIATEEAFIIPEIAAAVRDVVRQGGPNLDLKLLRLIYDAPADTAASAPPGTRDALARTFLPRLLDIAEGRLADMDSNGVDMHILSLTVPGVQMFDPANAVAFARLSNDHLADSVRRYPTRFAGLASFAPQDPPAAAKEMQRAMTSLKLNGFLVRMPLAESRQASVAAGEGRPAARPECPPGAPPRWRCA